MSPLQLTAKQQQYQRWRMCKAIAAGLESVTAIAHRYGVSRKTTYKWFHRWEAGGRTLAALAERSRAPHHQPRRLSPSVVATILATAHAHPRIGLVRLWRRLHVQGVRVSVYGVYRTLLRAGRYQRRRRRRGRKVYQRVVHTVPGAQVQVDLMHLTHGYQLTLIDSATRWLAACVLPSKDVVTVLGALRRLIATLPFRVQTLQTDHGTEFTYAALAQARREHPLTAWCQRQGIVHRLIPIAYPQANGKVERVHRICREEFYRTYRLRPGQTWTAWLPRYVTYYNTRREHGSLEWRTPAAMLQHLRAPQQEPAAHAKESVTDV
jgi:transposase InsO family protein